MKITNKDLIFLLTITNNAKNKDTMHLTAKTVIINELIENTLSNIANLSQNMNLDILYIVSINIDEEYECEALELKEPSQIVYIEIGIKVFIERMLNSEHDF